MSLHAGWDSWHRGVLKLGEQSPFSGVNPPDSGAAAPQQEGQGRGAPTMQTACLCSYSNCFRLLASGHPALDLPATPPEASTEAGAGPWSRVTCVSPACHPCVTPRAALPPARWTPQSHAGPAGPCFTHVSLSRTLPLVRYPNPPPAASPSRASPGTRPPPQELGAQAGAGPGALPDVAKQVGLCVSAFWHLICPAARANTQKGWKCSQGVGILAGGTECRSVRHELWSRLCWGFVGTRIPEQVLGDDG